MSTVMQKPSTVAARKSLEWHKARPPMVAPTFFGRFVTRAFEEYSLVSERGKEKLLNPHKYGVGG